MKKHHKRLLIRECIVLVILCSACNFLFAQKLDGRYSGDYGEIIISGDTLLFKRHKSSHFPPWWELDTIAKCSVTKINKYLLEINSVTDDLYDTWSIEQSHEDRSDDSIKINFVIPYNLGDLEIGVYTGPHFEEFKNNNYEKSVTIPKCDDFGFYIMPTRKLVAHGFVVTYGRIILSSSELSSEDFAIEQGKNRIDVKIPTLDDYFFVRYFLYHEYVYVKGDELHWRDRIYKKKK